MARPCSRFVLAAPLAAALLLSALAPSPVGAQEPAIEPSRQEPAIETVELPSPGSPLVAIRLMFRAGSIHDPQGKEGLAAERSYAELLEALYPMAAEIGADTDREVSVVAGETHVENLDAYADLLVEAVLRPGFAEPDFERNKDQLLSFLTSTLRSGNDELLGLEALQQEIFDRHPYGPSPAGTVTSLAAITLDDVKAFYRERFTRADLILGVAGGYPEDFPGRLRERLAGLSVEEVNAAIAKHLQTDGYEAVMVLGGAAATAAALFADQPSPIEYQSEVPEDVLAEDQAIVPLAVKPTAVEIVPVARMFE